MQVSTQAPAQAPTSPAFSTPTVVHAASKNGTDERVRDIGLLHGLLSRPEFGAISGTVLVVLIFAVAAGSSGMFNLEGSLNWMTVAAFLGIVACGAALLMIGGEFDLSIGSMIGSPG
jgi:simple sugar transport system permease protein